jgi:methylenetetrahydrofolate reductase (NADPH)
VRIADLLSLSEPCFSFEFFPPRTEDGTRSLMETVAALRPLEPAFVSVTYGAGGSNRGRTLDVVGRIRRELQIETMAHVTCAGASRDELSEVLDGLQAAGVENVICLRGDPPKGLTAFEAAADGFAHANELVGHVRGRARLPWRGGGAAMRCGLRLCGAARFCSPSRQPRSCKNVASNCRRKICCWID